VVCFEPLPLRFPVALEFEAAIEAELKSHPFDGPSKRMPVQLFDVEGIEGFGDLFGLPIEWELLLDAITKRSLSPNRVINRFRETEAFCLPEITLVHLRFQSYLSRPTE